MGKNCSHNKYCMKSCQVTKPWQTQENKELQLMLPLYFSIIFYLLFLCMQNSSMSVGVWHKGQINLDIALICVFWNSVWPGGAILVSYVILLQFWTKKLLTYLKWSNIIESHENTSDFAERLKTKTKKPHQLWLISAENQSWCFGHLNAEMGNWCPRYRILKTEFTLLEFQASSLLVGTSIPLVEFSRLSTWSEERVCGLLMIWAHTG